MVTCKSWPVLGENGAANKNMLRNFQAHKSIDMDLNTYHNKDKGIKINYTVSKKINPRVDYYLGISYLQS